MFGGNKNLKDLNSPLPVLSGNQGEDGGGSLSYTKTHKLITALFMVTDILDKEEPLRNKLRTLGVEIISDTNLIQNPVSRSSLHNKIEELLSFLDIASAVNIISEMNCNILKKEFLEFSQSIKEAFREKGNLKAKINLAEFFREDREAEAMPLLSDMRRGNPHRHPTRIGVQKGSTLMRALSQVRMSDRANFNTNHSESFSHVQDFDILKRQRRDDIVKMIGKIGDHVAIKDIKDKAKTMPEQSDFLVSCSEKTLQRELVGMVRDGVLNKTGDKRWSRYSLKLGSSN